jgi:shikimate kinase
MFKNMQKKFRNILLIGMPGSGKSTFGKAYAIHSGRYFLDFDHYLEYVTKKKIPDIFEKEGEEGFRHLEDMILRKLEKKHNYVIAMGGGTLCSERNFEFARRLGLIVYLETPLEILAQRIEGDRLNKINPRPLFSRLETKDSLMQKLTELWDERKEFYERSYIHLNTEFSSQDNLKLQLGLYEKKTIEREKFKEKQASLFGGSRSFSQRRDPSSRESQRPVSQEKPSGEEQTSSSAREPRFQSARENAPRGPRRPDQERASGDRRRNGDRRQGYRGPSTPQSKGD